MTTPTIPELEQIATQATDLVACEFALYGFDDPPRITPGMARAVLEAVQSDYVLSSKPKQPRPTGSRRGPSAERARETPAHEVGAQPHPAANGAPSRTQGSRPESAPESDPRPAHLQKAAALAARMNSHAPAANRDWAAGLADDDPLRDYIAGLDDDALAWRKVDRLVRLDLVHHVIRTLATDGWLTQAVFDANRPRWMSTGTAHCMSYETTWADLVQTALGHAAP